MMLATALTIIAIVTQDQSALRAAPRETAAQQAVLWQGDRLEIRAEKGDYLQVYDHRRERAGYVRTTQVRVQSIKPEAAPELLSIVRFLKDAPGSEALGIGYASAYLMAVPPGELDPAALDALGTMAERLARRASMPRSSKATAEAVAAHLEVAAEYGVGMTNFEREDQMQLCYDGEAFKRVLALPATDVQKADAALALTRHDCVPPSLTPVERFAFDNWRAELLDRVSMGNLPEVKKNRMHLRKAGVWASLAFQLARRPESSAAAMQAAASRSLEELAAVNKSELMESDAWAYSEAAIRVGASRWAAVPVIPTVLSKNQARVSVVATQGQAGETCIHLIDAKHGADKPLVSRCTYAIVWTASATANRDGTALALAVQPLDTWREMWVFKQGPDGWSVDIVPPGFEVPNLGYVEFAGWVPGNSHVLAAREVKADGRFRLSFETLRFADLGVDKQADKPGNLSLFYRWQDPTWKAQTVSLR